MACGSGTSGCRDQSSDMPLNRCALRGTSLGLPEGPSLMVTSGTITVPALGQCTQPVLEMAVNTEP